MEANSNGAAKQSFDKSTTSTPKKHIITISGKPGSGKSTISKELSSVLGYKHFSSGDLFRVIAREKHVTVDKINLLAETDTSIDTMVDQKLRDICINEDEIVIDSRMAWYWIPQSFKIYLNLDLSIAADRIYNTNNKERFENEVTSKNVKEYEEQLKVRLRSEEKRYMKLYQQNPYDTVHYDLVIDTHYNNPKQIIEIITRSYEEWLAK
ncbi:MAG: cytidylate kinase family protein [Candidatus Paceibacterota bacterium]